MASSIRVRATSNGDTTEVQALIQHPMDSGFVKDAKGEIIPPHFIQQLTFEYDGKPVFLADWAAASPRTLMSNSLQGGKKGDDLKSAGRQQGRNRHHHGEDSMTQRLANCVAAALALGALAFAPVTRAADTSIPQPTRRFQSSSPTNSPS